jgi:hypothetical protein
VTGTQPRARPKPHAQGQLEIIDAFIDPQIRLAIEQTYYARINAQCSLAAAVNDPSFVENPGKHVAVFADHGIVHARDVATQVLGVLDAVHGVLIPPRDPGRLGWMKAYGVLVAFVHDIGMVDLSPVGRAMHPEFATQAVLGPAFDDIMARLWSTDRGGFAGRLRRSGAAGHLQGQSAEAVAREILAMANCHSKSKVPVALLNEPAALRRMMQVAATTDLRVLHARQRGVEDRATIARPTVLRPEGFAWLEASGAPGRALVDDVIDTLRVLRCADALRQRGTLLKTSGNYEVFVDRRSANAVFAFRPDARHLFLLELPEPIAAGEANLAGSQLDPDGNLRISFHRGMFRDEETVLRAARSAALIVNDIQADAIGSFARGDASGHPGLRSHAEARILIEPVDDNPAFAGRVRDELAALNPAAAERVRIVSAGRGCDAPTRAGFERDRVGRGSDLDWDPDRAAGFLRRLQQSGHRADRIDPVAGFRGMRRIELRSGERLIEAGTPSDFVYVALGEGLRGRPLGGYDEFPVRPWIPIGITGVIRGAARNSEIRAEQDVTLIAIPADVFLDHWHFTYDQKAFAELLAGRYPQGD